MTTNSCLKFVGQKTDYHTMSIIRLAECIVDSDREALCEFHDNRRIFRFEKNESLLLAEFIDTLCNSRWALGLAGHNYNLIEKTYDHLIDRFSNIPCDDYPQGSDCRYYFDAFLTSIHRLFKQNNVENPLQKELLSVKALQNRVLHHFKYCLKESARDLNPLRTRYQWDVSGSTIIVWMPVFIAGNNRKAWLEEHILAPDPANPTEKYRIQQIIDRELGMPAFEDYEYCRENFGEHDSRYSLPGQEIIDVKGLASAVADEKVENINSLRPAIKALGKQKLGNLIRCIFRDISYDSYEEKSIAHRFGISQSTLTRFAGSRWQISAFERCPDLWSNLARVLAGNTDFTEAAKQYGLWDKILKTIEIKG